MRFKKHYTLAEARALLPQLRKWLVELNTARQRVSRHDEREIQLKDPQRGLIDFPAIREGREVFLCWKQDEDDIEYWHDLDAGYAGREKLQE